MIISLKSKGRNIFDSDKGEDGEEAFDYYEIMHYDLNRKRRSKKYFRTVNDEQEKKLDFSSYYVDNSEQVNEDNEDR